MPNEMTAHKPPRVVDLLCTPEDLRKLAARADSKMRKIQIGEDTLVEYIHGKNVTIAVRLDQDRV